MSLEGTSMLEQYGLRKGELPETHLEGMAPSQLEGLNEAEKTRLVGEHYFVEDVSQSPGTLAAFQKISSEGTKEEFASYYERYVNDSRDLEVKEPQVYDFFRDRIFYGKEFNLSGMEKFMRDTAPDTKERVASTVDITSTENLLPRTALHYSIPNCRNPFSYGDIGRMAEKMDYKKGDTALLPIAPDRMVACRNLMALCGEHFTEADVTKFAVDQKMVAYDPLYLKGFSYDNNEIFLPDIIRGMSGVEVYKPELFESGDPVEAMAALLDRGHRGMVTYNPTLLSRADPEAVPPATQLLDKMTRSAKETSTLLGAVRDGDTGKVTGFMICDSTKNEVTRYVEADRLMYAMNVKHGHALFTKQPYLDK